MAEARQVRLCIVGCGVIVDAHLAAILAASPQQFEVTALVDPNEENREAIAKRVVAELVCPAHLGLPLPKAPAPPCPCPAPTFPPL